MRCCLNHHSLIQRYTTHSERLAINITKLLCQIIIIVQESTEIQYFTNHIPFSLWPVLIVHRISLSIGLLFPEAVLPPHQIDQSVTAFNIMMANGARIHPLHSDTEKVLLLVERGNQNSTKRSARLLIEG